jgi:hypothetical protein
MTSPILTYVHLSCIHIDLQQCSAKCAVQFAVLSVPLNGTQCINVLSLRIDVLLAQLRSSLGITVEFRVVTRSDQIGMWKWHIRSHGGLGSHGVHGSHGMHCRHRGHSAHRSSPAEQVRSES